MAERTKTARDVCCAGGAAASATGAVSRRGAARRLNRRMRAIILLGVLAAALVVVLAAGLAMPEDWYAPNYAQKSLMPSWEHPFGTDYLGHDMFCRSIRGLSLSIVIGLFASLVSGGIALVLGVVSAVCGGWVDRALLWLADLCMSVPHMVILILVSFAIGGGTLGRRLRGSSAPRCCASARLSSCTLRAAWASRTRG